MGTLQGLCTPNGDILNPLPAHREAPTVAGIPTFLTVRVASVMSPYPHYPGQDISLQTLFSLRALNEVGIVTKFSLSVCSY